MFQKILILCLFGLVCSMRKELTPEQLEKLSSWDVKNNNNRLLWIESGQTEGDMILLPGQVNGDIANTVRWENREIPYEIDDVFTDEEKSIINEAVKEFANVSCVTIRPKTDSDVDYIHITGEDSGCWSFIGRLGGRQDLNLQKSGCVDHGTIIHEFLHVAGFFHEQNLINRDDYLQIVSENIASGMEHQFEKQEADYNIYGQPYDVFTIMIYTEYAFSSNGEPTIIPYNENAIGKLGYPFQFTDYIAMGPIDIIKLNYMYGCY